MFNIFEYTPPGPIAQAFIEDDSFTPAIMGPVGSGKTTACIFKRFRFAMTMPVCRDGWMRCKGLVIRDTYRTLEKTVLPSWWAFFPKDYPGSEWIGGNDRPAQHTIRFQLPNGLKLETITQFEGLNGQRVEDVLRGRELSWAWGNEFDLMQQLVLRMLQQRVGRYPSKALLPEGVEVKSQVIGDLNAPDIENYVYKDFVESPLPGHNLHVQPSGRSKNAENRKNLPPDYYERLVEVNEPWWVRRFVDNQFGYSREGQPVYEEFNDQIHVSDKDIPIDPNLPLVIGLDAGLTPAAIFGQPTRLPQMRILDELVPGHGYGTTRFAELLASVLAERYSSIREIYVYADPAAQWGADKEAGELSWIDAMSRALGLPVMVPGNGSNELGLRLDAVRQSLVAMPDGRSPGLIVSRRCPKIIRGFASGYRYRKNPSTGQVQGGERPEKNDYSHPHDALQYLMLGWKGRTGVISHAARETRFGRQGGAHPQARKKGGFDVFNM